MLAGHRLTAEEGLAVLRSGDCELLDMLAAAYRVRYRRFGNRVHLNFLNNAKSGLCSEDCGYCSQSRVSTADISKIRMLSPEEILDGARVAAERRAGTYCIVISGRAPGDREIERICEVAARIKQDWSLRVCASVGLLTAEQAARLKRSGVDRVNHNLNTSERFYPAICSTHTYPGAAGNPRRDPPGRVGNLLRRNRRHGRRGRRPRRPGPAPRRTAGRSGAGEFSACRSPARRWPLRTARSIRAIA